MKVNKRGKTHRVESVICNSGSYQLSRKRKELRDSTSFGGKMVLSKEKRDWGKGRVMETSSWAEEVTE